MPDEARGEPDLAQVPNEVVGTRPAQVTLEGVERKQPAVHHEAVHHAGNRPSVQPTAAEKEPAAGSASHNEAVAHQVVVKRSSAPGTAVEQRAAMPNQAVHHAGKRPSSTGASVGRMSAVPDVVAE